MENEVAVIDKVVLPAVTPAEAVEAWKKYQDLKKEIVEKEDIQVIQNREFLKKSYWRKLATFFNLTVECVNEKSEQLTGGDIVFYITYKATARNGRSAYGDGSCNLLEKNHKNSIHNTRGTAHTRAFNRAVSNLVGGGEVSAEEVTADDINHNGDTETPQDEKKLTAKQLSRFWAIAYQTGHPKEDIETIVKDLIQKDIKDHDTWTIQEYDEVCKYFENLPKASTTKK